MRRIIAVIFSVIVLPGVVFAQSAQDYQTLKADYEKLREKFEEVSKDRENLLSQTKFLLKYKEEILSAQQALTNIEQERNKWEIEKQSLNNTNKKLQSEIQLLQNQTEDVRIEVLQVEQERDDLKNSLSKSKAGYIIVDDLKKQLNDEKRESARLNSKVEKLTKKIDELTDQANKRETELSIAQGQIKEIKKKYDEALRSNNILEKKMLEQPKEYAELARENKVLLKRTALMHYNLGVFYTKNKEYSRAVSEFEKSIELNPEDAYAYFNLGYIYAEYLIDRPKSIENFKKYLLLAKKDDKDVDWAKKYILTWQTWEGKDALR